MAFNFEYGEDEINYYYGLIEAVGYYKRCHDAGFDIKEKEAYLVDFSDYSIGQGYDYSNTCETKLYSILKPFMKTEGYVSTADALNDEEIDDFVAMGLKDSRDNGEAEYGYNLGYYAYIDSDIASEFKKKGLDTDEDFLGFFKKLCGVSTGSFVNRDGTDMQEVDAVLREEGLYFYVADANVMIDGFHDCVLDLMCCMRAKLKEAKICQS